MSAQQQIVKRANQELGRKVVSAMKKDGAKVYGCTWVPADGGYMPMANGEKGYLVDHNGTSRVMRYMDIKNEWGE